MQEIIFYVKDAIEGKNSVLFQSSEGYIFYEKLSNTIHVNDIKSLDKLRCNVEAIKYHPRFESESLKKGCGKKLESLLLNVTESCNLSCSYCIYSGNYENEHVENKRKMDFKIGKKAIDQFMPLSKERVLIGFYGGEPLTNMDLIKNIIKYTKRKYPKKTSVFSMTSNFCNADKYMKEIVENEIYINISLDGPKHIHDKNRRFKNGKPTYNKIIENLKKIETIYPGYGKKHFSQSVTCEDPNDLPEIVQFFQKNKQFNISRINKVESKGLINRIIKDNKSSNTFKFVSNYLSSILSEKDPEILRLFFDQNLKNIVIKSKKLMPKKLMLNGCCYPGNRKLFVNTDGKFYICERFGERVSIGDVNKGIEKESINNAIDKFTEIKNSYCKDCWAQRLCHNCIQSSKDSKGEISERGLAETCNSNKSQILIALTNYVSLISKNKKIFENYVDSIQFK